jgi:uncharacterized protein YgbK (DUF1537 family)
MIAHTVLHVAADDRTGALEVAAALADRGAGGNDGVGVTIWPEQSSSDMCVVDLESRHLSSQQAATRAAALVVAGPAAHKIDSTLRGNWARELVARHLTSRMPVLLVPALPALGRVCVGGVVLNGGRPVHDGDADVRQALGSSRPADHLRAAGAIDVVEFSTVAGAAAWIAAPLGYAIVDAASDADVEAIVALWPGSGILLAGTSATVAAAARKPPWPIARRINGPALIVCGSANPAARRQLALIADRGTTVAKDAAGALQAVAARRDVILATPTPSGPVDAEQAQIEVARLAAEATEVVAKGSGLAALIVLGGDTAAALLGDTAVRVLGSVTPGTAWLVSPRFQVPVITRAGGFGDDRAIADLLWGTLRS